MLICMVAQRLPHKSLGNQWVVRQSCDQLSWILTDSQTLQHPVWEVSLGNKAAPGALPYFMSASSALVKVGGILREQYNLRIQAHTSAQRRIQRFKLWLCRCDPSIFAMLSSHFVMCMSMLRLPCNQPCAFWFSWTRGELPTTAKNEPYFTLYTSLRFFK